MTNLESCLANAFCQLAFEKRLTGGNAAVLEGRFYAPSRGMHKARPGKHNAFVLNNSEQHNSRVGVWLGHGFGDTNFRGIGLILIFMVRRTAQKSLSIDHILHVQDNK